MYNALCGNLIVMVEANIVCKALVSKFAEFESK